MLNLYYVGLIRPIFCAPMLMYRLYTALRCSKIDRLSLNIASLKRSILFSALLIWSPAHAWWSTPHLIITEIAYQNLTPETRNKVDCLLGEDFVETGNWADTIRKQGNHQYNTWHYVVLNYEDINDSIPDFPKEENVAWAIEHEMVILQDPDQSQQAKAEALKRLVHWVGDIHQPMHASTYVSQAYPKGDRGGNLYKIDMPKAYNNLHAYWDSGLLQWPRLPQPLSEQDKKRLSSMAKNLQAQHPTTDSSTDPYDWALESHALGRQARENINDTEWGRGVARERVVLAGHRLASILNTL